MEYQYGSGVTSAFHTNSLNTVLQSRAWWESKGKKVWFLVWSWKIQCRQIFDILPIQCQIHNFISGAPYTFYITFNECSIHLWVIVWLRIASSKMWPLSQFCPRTTPDKWQFCWLPKQTEYLAPYLTWGLQYITLDNTGLCLAKIKLNLITRSKL